MCYFLRHGSLPIKSVAAKTTPLLLVDFIKARSCTAENDVRIEWGLLYFIFPQKCVNVLTHSELH